MRPLLGVGYIFVRFFIFFPFFIIEKDCRFHEFLPTVFSVSVQFYFTVSHFFGFWSPKLAAQFKFQQVNRADRAGRDRLGVCNRGTDRRSQKPVLPIV